MTRPQSSKEHTTQQLVNCYDDQAEHFGKTREKSWPEFDYLLQAIDTYGKKLPKVRPTHTTKSTRTTKSTSQKSTQSIGSPHVSLIDIGCGTGRFYDFLAHHCSFPIDYTGIDIAHGMIDRAAKHYPEGKRAVADMVPYIQKLPQESVDIIVGIASIQHLFDTATRKEFFAASYRALRWGGQLLLINRSYSNWFLRRYWLQQFSGLVRNIFSTHHHWNDLTIPWKDPNYQYNHKIFGRHYHMFTLYELEQLARLHGFVIQQQGYVQQDGSLHPTSWAKARNTRMWLGKGIEV